MYPTPVVEHFHCLRIKKIEVSLSAYVWPQATGGPKPLVSNLLPPPKVFDEAEPSAPSSDGSTIGATGLRHNSLLPEAHVPKLPP